MRVIVQVVALSMASAVEWTSSVVGDGECPRPKLAAVVFPQYHSDPTNNELWGDGYTEWVALNGTTDPLLPRPIEPLGYYDLMADGTMETQAAMARDHGIDAFFYYHYWFGDGRRVLDGPVEKLLKTKSPDFPFALVWAVESWSPQWHGKNQTSHFEDIDTSTWPTQNITVENMRAHVRWLETEVWSDPRYVRIDDRPVFILHGGGCAAATWNNVSLIMDVLKESPMNPYVGITMRGVRPMSMRGHRNVKLVDHYKHFFINMVAKFDFSILWEARTDALSNLMDSVVDTAVCDAQDVHNDAMTSPDPALAAVDWELGAFAGFDNIARHPTASHLAVRLRVDEDHTGRDRPAELGRQLATLAALNQGRPRGRKCANFIIINAWNEWGEGNVLEPNDLTGYRMLETTKSYADGTLSPDTDLLERCPTMNHELVAEDGSVDMARVRSLYDIMDTTLHLWRQRDVPVPPPRQTEESDSSASSRSDDGTGKVFVVGMHKTGTTSMAKALGELGYNVFQLDWAGEGGPKKCFRSDAYQSTLDGLIFNQQNRWHMMRCLDKEFDIFRNFTAFQDTPFYGLSANLIRKFPKAKIIYLRRSLDDWLNSTYDHFVTYPARHDGVWTSKVINSHGHWIQADAIETIHGTMYGTDHAAPRNARDQAIWAAAYTKQLQEVLQTVINMGMEDHFLVMDLHMGDGYDKLGPFLGRPDAASWVFKHENERHTRHTPHTHPKDFNNEQPPSSV